MDCLRLILWGIVQRGGLLAFIKQEELERIERERKRQAEPKRIRRERERQREREVESEALSRKGRRTKVSVVVQSSPPATKQSSCVKIEDRTLRQSTEPLKERDLLRVGESIIKTEDLLFGLRARKEVLERRLRRQGNVRVRTKTHRRCRIHRAIRTPRSLRAPPTLHIIQRVQRLRLRRTWRTLRPLATPGGEGSDLDV
ncbi:hypothetical protein GB937_010380 [Aspergillus fischeri]|nr:hypothetical protein GB937_010380 [Aspergillus fischeri]